MQNEPQLKTGIGNGNADFVVASYLFGLKDVRVFVDVKDAPDLVVFTAPPTAIVTRLLSLRCYRLLNELERAAAKGVDSDKYPVPMAPKQINKVQLFSSEAFYE